MGRVGLFVPTGRSMKIRRFDSEDAREPLMATQAEQPIGPFLVHVSVVDSQPNKRSSLNRDSEQRIGKQDLTD